MNFAKKPTGFCRKFEPGENHGLVGGMSSKSSRQFYSTTELAEAFPVSNGRLHQLRNIAADKAKEAALRRPSISHGTKGSTAKTAGPARRISSSQNAEDKKLAEASSVGGIGLELLQKMGWRAGQGLGKQGDGPTELVTVKLKTDRKGLASQDEKHQPQLPKPKTPIRATQQQQQQQQQHQQQRQATYTCTYGQQPGWNRLKGKKAQPTGRHDNMYSRTTMCGSEKWQSYNYAERCSRNSTNLLIQLAQQRGWPNPQFCLVSQTGPDHSKQFVYCVKILGMIYQPNWTSPRKTLARAAAADLALCQLGLGPIVNAQSWN